MYRIQWQILNSNEVDFQILVKIACFGRKHKAGLHEHVCFLSYLVWIPYYVLIKPHCHILIRGSISYTLLAINFWTNIIIIIISILKPLFLYRGLGLFDKSSSKTSSPLRTVHWISKIHSKLLSVIHQHFIPGFLRPARSLLCNYI